MKLDMKPPTEADTRPKKFLWAPGGYSCKCSICNNEFIGDKRAVMCANCAYSEIADALWSFIKKAESHEN